VSAQEIGAAVESSEGNLEGRTETMKEKAVSHDSQGREGKFQRLRVCLALGTAGAAVGVALASIGTGTIVNAVYSGVTSNLGYTPLSAPVRIADTRTGATDPSTYQGLTLAAGGSLTIDMPTNVPAGAGAVVVQVTAINPSASGFLTVFPAGSTNPGTANVNFTTGQTVGNQVTVGLGTSNGNEAITVYDGPTTGGSVDFTVDLYGYYSVPTATSGDAYVPLTPSRICDTRSGNPSGLSGTAAQCNGTNNTGDTLGAATALTFGVTDVGNVPTGAAAVQLNVAVTDTTASSYIQCYPAGSPPSSSTPTVNQNWVAGETLSTKALVAVGTDGDVTCYNNSGAVDLVVDVDGYFTAPGTSGGDLFTALSSPVRLCDTRISTTGCASGAVGGGSSRAVPVAGASGIPSGAVAGVLNVVDVQPATGNYLTAYPAGVSAPTATDVNWVPADTYNVVPNASYAAVGTSPAGDVEVLNGPSTAGYTNVVVDAFGFFAPPSAVTVAVTANPSSLTANGTSTSTVTATVTNSGVPVSGDEVGFLTSGSPSAACGLLSFPTPTNSSGQATVTYTASTTAGTCTITATEDDYGQSGSTTITQTAPVANTTYTVTPTTPQSLSVSTVSTPSGHVTYTVTGFTSTNTPSGSVYVTLFPASGTDAPVDTSGQWTFTSSAGSGVAGTAAGQGTSTNGTPGTCTGSGTTGCSAYIAYVNGSTTTATTNATTGAISTTSGSITFTLNSWVADSTVPVVFTVPSGGTAGVLELGTNGQPATGYAFGVGGSATWTVPTSAATAGTYSDMVVSSVNNSAGTFVACADATTNCYTFTDNVAGDSYIYLDPSGTITVATFQSYLSGGATSGSNGVMPDTAGTTGAGTNEPLTTSSALGDELNITYNPSSTSTFSFTNGTAASSCTGVSCPSLGSPGGPAGQADVPAAPTGLGATTSSTPPVGTQLSWGAPPNADATADSSATYIVYAATVTSGVVGTYDVVGTMTASGTPTTASDTANSYAVTNCATASNTCLVITSGLTAGTTYSFVVSAASGTGYANTIPAEGPGSGAIQFTPTTSGTSSATPVATATSVTGTSPLMSGDALFVGFNTDVTVSSTASFTVVADNGAEATITCGTNATCSGSGTKTLAVTLTGPPSFVLPGSTSPGTIPFTSTDDFAVTAATGVTDSSGSWNLPGSDLGDITTCTAGGVGSPDNGYCDYFTANSSSGTAPPTAIPAKDLTGVTPGSTTVTVSKAAYILTTPAITASSTIAAYNTNGMLLGSSSVPNPATTATTITLSSPLVAGEVLQLVWTGPGTAGTSAAQPSATQAISVMAVTGGSSTATAGTAEATAYSVSDPGLGNGAVTGYSIPNATSPNGTTSLLPLTFAGGAASGQATLYLAGSYQPIILVTTSGALPANATSAMGTAPVVTVSAASAVTADITSETSTTCLTGILTPVTWTLGTFTQGGGGPTSNGSQTLVGSAAPNAACNVVVALQALDNYGNVTTAGGTVPLASATPADFTVPASVTFTSGSSTGSVTIRIVLTSAFGPVDLTIGGPTGTVYSNVVAVSD
jgi:hypothetical protein